MLVLFLFETDVEDVKADHSVVHQRNKATNLICYFVKQLLKLVMSGRRVGIDLVKSDSLLDQLRLFFNKVFKQFSEVVF